METSEGLVDEREGLGFGLEEEWIVVTTDLAIEGGEAVWREIASWVRVERGLYRPVSIIMFYSFPASRNAPSLSMRVLVSPLTARCRDRVAPTAVPGFYPG